MSLYLLASTPAVLLIVLFSSPCIQQRKRLLFSQLTHAFIVFLPAYFFLRLLVIWLDPVYTLFLYILYVLSIEILLPALIAVAGNLYLHRRQADYPVTVCKLLVFFYLFYTFFAFFDTLSFVQGHGNYTLFVLPTFRLLIATLAASGVYAYQMERRKPVLGCAVVFFACGILQAVTKWWAITYQTVFMVCSTVLALAGTAVLLIQLLSGGNMQHVLVSILEKAKYRIRARKE